MRTAPPTTAARRRPRSGEASPRSRLEQLDDVPGRVEQQDLLAARTFDDVVAELRPRVAQPRDLGDDVVDVEVDAVPATRTRLFAIGHRPSRGARRAREQQTQVAAFDV